jgi:hypothetical protein
MNEEADETGGADQHAPVAAVLRRPHINRGDEFIGIAQRNVIVSSICGSPRNRFVAL